MPKQIIKLSASVFKESSCLLRTHYTVIKGYTADLAAIDTQFGTAFHAFVARMRLSNGDMNLAIKEAKEIFRKPCIYKKQKEYMTENFLLTTCMNYWTEVALNDEWHTIQDEASGAHMVEMKFALPYYQDDEVEVILCGTVDDICRMGVNGVYAIRDYKTTSSWNIREYFDGYRLSPQLMFYVYIMQLYAKMYPDSLIAKIVGNNGLQLGTMIEGIFLKGAAKPVEFVKSEVFYFKQPQMDEFKFILDKKIAEIVAEVKRYNATGVEPYRYGMLNGACTTVYGKCKFSDACAAPDDIARQHVLRNNFIQVDFNPLNYHA